MNYAAQNVTLAESIIDAMLAALSARPAAALLTTPKLHLSKDPAVTFTPQTTAAELAAQEADFSGYTAGGYAVTLVGPVNLGTMAEGLLMNQVFVRTLGAPDVGNQVYAWWIDAVEGFVCGEAFPNGIALDLPGDFLDLLAILPLSLLPSFVI